MYEHGHENELKEIDGKEKEEFTLGSRPPTAPAKDEEEIADNSMVMMG